MHYILFYSILTLNNLCNYFTHILWTYGIPKCIMYTDSNFTIEMLDWWWSGERPKHVATLGCRWLYILLCSDGINHSILFWESKHKGKVQWRGAENRRRLKAAGRGRESRRPTAVVVRGFIHANANIALFIYLFLSCTFSVSKYTL
jgi:hypothetical protein